MSNSPRWSIPISDGSPPIAIEIRANVVPPCVHVALDDYSRLLMPMEAAQLALALAEASKEAGRLAAKGRKR